MTRAIVVWLPDWPITAFLRTSAHAGAASASGLLPAVGAAGAVSPASAAAPVPGTPVPGTPGATAHAPAPAAPAPAPPLAIVHANRVVACSAAARAEGVRRGQRRRDAQAACAALRIAPADEGRDERAFRPVLTALDELAPGVQPLRPGLAALRARGPARFYGGEEQAARALLDALAALGLPDARAGIADGVFTADRAARLTRATERVRVVPAGRSADFLAPLPITAIDDEELVLLLLKLGIRTLGAFAALDIRQIRDRLGEHGARLHDLARGADSRPVVPTPPPPTLAREIAFEPPLELAEQVAFAVRTTAEEVCTALGEANLVCTEMRITLSDDRGERSERVWLHPTRFDPVSLIDRVRWQLQADDDATRLTGGVCLARFEPVSVDDGAHHRPTLIGQGPDERLHHVLSRVQSMLGHRGVVSPVLGGGRWLDEREVRVAWGDGERPAQPRGLPWPGALPAPLPAEVFRERRTVRVATADGGPVSVDERGVLSAPPGTIEGRPVVAWAGPWPVVERGWDAERARRAHRFQVVDETQTAWLVVREGDGWWVEGRYA